MPRSRPLADAIVALVITTLLAASNAEGKEEDNDWSPEAGGVVERSTIHYSRATCYDYMKRPTKCTKKDLIVAGSIVGSVIGLLALMSLWFKWSDWRKKRRDRSDVEEAESLNDGSEADSDYEKSIAKGRRSINKKGSRDGGDYDVIPLSPSFDKLEEASLSRSTSYSTLPAYDYDSPPGLTRPDTHPVAFPSYHMSSTRF